MPCRLSRRDLLRVAGVTAVATTAGGANFARDDGPRYDASSESSVAPQNTVATPPVETLERALWDEDVAEAPDAIAEDRDGTYVATNLRTGRNFWSDSDVAWVLEEVVEDMFRSRPNRGGTGTLFVRPGTYELERPVTIDHDDLESLTLAGGGQSKAGKAAVSFRPSDRFDDRTHDWLFSFGREDPANPGNVLNPKGIRLRGLQFVGLGKALDPVRLFGTDGWSAIDCLFSWPGPNNHGLRVDGGNEGYVRRCAVDNFYLHRNPINPRLGTNHFVAHDSAFRTNTDRVAMDMEGDGYMISNFVVNGRPANRPGSGSTPCLNSGCKRVRWSNGEFVGGGPPQLDAVSRMNFSNVDFNGETVGPNVRNPWSCSFTNCNFYSPSHNFLWTENGDVRLHAVHFEGYGSSDGEPAIESRGKNDHGGLAVYGCSFRDDGPSYDVELGWCVGPATIANNTFTNGVWNRYVDEGFWDGRFDSPGELISVVENAGFNPVGFSRETPPLPETAGVSVGNPGHQTATVYHEGGDGVIVADVAGRQTSLGTANRIPVPSQGTVSFAGTVPDSWSWYWH